MLQVPERRRDSDCESGAASRLERALYALRKGHNVLEVLAPAAPVVGHGVLLVDVDAVKVVLLEELDNGLSKLASAGGAARNVAERRARRARVVKRLAADGNIGAEIRIGYLQRVKPPV